MTGTSCGAAGTVAANAAWHGSAQNALLLEQIGYHNTVPAQLEVGSGLIVFWNGYTRPEAAARLHS
jgi:hypothetical protein